MPTVRMRKKGVTVIISQEYVIIRVVTYVFPTNLHHINDPMDAENKTVNQEIPSNTILFCRKQSLCFLIHLIKI